MMMRLLATNSPQICAVFTIAATKHEKKLAFRSLVELDWIELEGREGGGEVCSRFTAVDQ